MKLAYITAHSPFGRGETFVLEEMVAMRELGAKLVTIPRNPPKEAFHEDAQKLMDNTIWLPLFNEKIVSCLLRSAALEPRVWKILSEIFRHSRTLKILAKNLVVVPKAVYIADLLRQNGIEHIHVHWGSTTSTMAWIASELTNIPWSMTLHRWDIAENNLLKLKVDRAAFARCISEDGRNEVLHIVGVASQDKLKLLHMGVRLPEKPSPLPNILRTDFVIVCPANFVNKKGHRFLIDACGLLVRRGIRDLQCWLTSDGPLDAEIRSQIQQLGLEKVVRLLGRIQYRRLLDMYAEGEVDVVVLPSIVLADGEREGIPVALMEAMAYGIPVISTETGGIPELLKSGAGLLVPPGSSEELADAIAQIINKEDLRLNLAQKGRERISEEFDLRKNAALLFSMIDKHKGAKKA
jgi:glycosyltransferase involved in cell wall biosynthesis